MGLRFTDLCIDAHDTRALADWWAAVLNWPAEDTDDGDVALRAPSGAGSDWLFLAVPEGKTIKNRIHFDLTPDDQQAEVDRVVGLGARHVEIGQVDESWVVLADPEGNEFCILSAED